MNTWKDDPFEQLVVEESADEFRALASRLVTPAAAVPPLAGVVTARFDGFDLEDRPLISALPEVPGEVLPARATIALRRDDIGSTVVLLFERADVRRPIIIGVIQQRHADPPRATPAAPSVSVQADGDRMVIAAEREIVLRCGEASITLTRAGKVLIKGAYVSSRSSGYNRIKGAAVDIN